MLLKVLQNSPQKTVPVAMALVAVGLMLVVVSASWPHLAGLGANDFARGFLIGLGIMLEIGGVVLASAARRRGDKA